MWFAWNHSHCWKHCAKVIHLLADNIVEVFLTCHQTLPNPIFLAACLCGDNRHTPITEIFGGWCTSLTVWHLNMPLEMEGSLSTVALILIGKNELNSSPMRISERTFTWTNWGYSDALSLHLCDKEQRDLLVHRWNLNGVRFELVSAVMI